MCSFCYLDQDTTKHFRNFLYENAAKDLGFPCPYLNHGCEEIVRFNDKEHERHCLYRPFNCPASTVCGFKGDVKHIQEHLNSQHQDMCFSGDEITFTITRNLGLSKQTKILPTQWHTFVIEFSVYKMRTNNQFCATSVTEVTIEECRERKYTIAFKREPDMTFTKKLQVSNLLNSHIRSNHNISSLFKMCKSEEIVCTIAIDSPD